MLLSMTQTSSKLQKPLQDHSPFHFLDGGRVGFVDGADWSYWGGFSPKRRSSGIDFELEDGWWEYAVIEGLQAMVKMKGFKWKNERNWATGSRHREKEVRRLPMSNRLKWSRVGIPLHLIQPMAGGNQKGRLDQRDVWVDLTTRLLKTFEYPQLVTMFTLEECRSILQLVLEEGLPAAGICHNMNQQIFHVPLKYQGLVIPSLYTLQEINRLEGMVETSTS